MKQQMWFALLGSTMEEFLVAGQCGDQHVWGAWLDWEQQGQSNVRAGP